LYILLFYQYQQVTTLYIDSQYTSRVPAFAQYLPITAHVIVNVYLYTGQVYARASSEETKRRGRPSCCCTAALRVKYLLFFMAYGHPTDRRAPRDRFQFIFIDDGRSEVNFGRAPASGRWPNRTKLSLLILAVCHNIHPFYVSTIKGAACDLFFYSKTWLTGKPKNSHASQSDQISINYFCCC